MSDIRVTPWRSGWTVRHERILFERFENRSAALRRARELGRLLESQGITAELRCASSRRRAADG